MSDMARDFPMKIELQRRAKSRRDGESGAHEFQAWLGECRRRGLRVKIARDESHAIAFSGEPRG
jgi:hypothetical protein